MAEENMAPPVAAGPVGGGKKGMLNANTLFIGGIVGLILGMVTALGTVGTVLAIIGLIAGIIGLVLLIMETIKKQTKISGWIWFVVFVVIYFVSRSVALG